jgi:hypothetical protein
MRPGRRWIRGDVGAVFIAAVVFGSFGTSLTSLVGAAKAAATNGTAACMQAVGPFTVAGPRVLQADGRVFVPYGVTLSTLQDYPTSSYGAPKGQSTVSQTDAQLRAIAGGWCGNTVRLQIEQDMLVGLTGNAFNGAYMKAIEAAVGYAKSLGLVVVINAQTEPGGPSDLTRDEPLPTAATEAFWHEIDKVYGEDPQVVYDVFNEPRPQSTPASSEQTYWNEWLNGGRFTYTYNKAQIAIQAIGEQALANFIRRDGSSNLLWIEGLQSLDYLVSHPAYLIKGDGPIAYSYHHTANGLPHDAATWDAQFGELAKSGIAPVVDGEWTNYANNTGFTYANGDSGECWADAPVTVPAYLQYLQNLGIGMTVWTLGPGFMNSAPADYVTPTEFKSDWGCKHGLDEGAGQDVQDWYFENNSVPPPTNSAPPTISGGSRVGRLLSCSTGSWTGSPTGYGYQWSRDKLPIVGGTGGSYQVQAADAGHSIACTVTASNGSGSASSTSSAVTILIPCSQPSGRLHRAWLGPIRLGETRGQARRRMRRFVTYNQYTDNFCLWRGAGIRVAYGRLRSHGTRIVLARASGDVILAVTANPHYALDGIRPGERLAKVLSHYSLAGAISVGGNDWYGVPGVVSNGVVKVRHGVIREVGIANQRLATNRSTQLRLLRTF